MDPAEQPQPRVRRHDSISSVVRRVFHKFSSGNSSEEPTSPPREVSPPQTPVLSSRVAGPPPPLTSGRPTNKSVDVAVPSPAQPKLVPASPAPSTPPSSTWRKGSRRERKQIQLCGWLKVSLGNLRGMKWTLPTEPALFVVLEIDDSVFRSDVARSLSPSSSWSKKNFILAVNESSSESTSDAEELEEDDDAFVIKLFQRSSAVTKILLGTCKLPRGECVSFIAPTCVWVPLQRADFSDRRAGRYGGVGLTPIAELQLNLQFMPHETHDAGRKEEQLKIHLQREWVLAQKLLDEEDLSSFADPEEWSRHDSNDLSRIPISVGDDDTNTTTIDLSEYADCGYVFQRGGAALDENLGLSGSGESFSEDSNHYIMRPAAHHMRDRSAVSQFPLTSAPTRIDLGDFNARFQDIIDRLNSLYSTSSSTISERLAANINLLDLSDDFLYSCVAWGRIIISELNVPDFLKTIKPISIGGYLGGRKYLVRNILFKFATDDRNLFGGTVAGNDQASAKVAGNELRGNIAFFSTGCGLHCPLMCLLDYKGFRLVCCSYLPINNDTLVLGTSDAGRTFVNKHADLYEMVTRAATSLNLKPHLVGHDREKFHVFGPADLEGHAGLDGRLYLIDFSRHMPPIVGSQFQAKNTHLYRLLRPEFVSSYTQPLCADAFSGFMDPQNAENREVEEANRYLLSVTVPEFARQLCRLLSEESRLSMDGSIARFRLTEACHRYGLNMCLLGRIHECALLGKLMPEARDLVLIEAVARVVKQELRAKLRERVRESTTPLSSPYIYCVVQFFNDVFGNFEANAATSFLWKELFPKKLVENFAFKHSSDLYRRVKACVFFPSKRRAARSASTSNDDTPLRTSFDLAAPPQNLNANAVRSNGGGLTGFFLILERVIAMMGLQFNAKTLEDLEKDQQLLGGRGTNVFDRSDLVHLGERVKKLNIVSLAEGYVSIYKGHKASFAKDYVSSLRYFTLALNAYQAALDSSPQDPSLLRSVGKVYMEIEKATVQRDGIPARRMRDSPYLTRADFFFRLSLGKSPEPSALTDYASFLEQCREYDAAESYLLKALSIDPNHISALKLYATFLKEIRSCVSLGDRFLERSEDNLRFLKGESVRAPSPPVTSPRFALPVAAAISASAANRPTTRPRSASHEEAFAPRIRSLSRRASFSGDNVPAPADAVAGGGGDAAARPMTRSRSSSLSNDPEQSADMGVFQRHLVRVDAHNDEVSL